MRITLRFSGKYGEVIENAYDLWHSTDMSLNRLGLEPVLVLLFVGILIFAATLIAVDILLPKEGEVFTTMAALLSGFSGAFFGRINPTTPAKQDPQNPLGLNAKV